MTVKEKVRLSLDSTACVLKRILLTIQSEVSWSSLLSFLHFRRKQFTTLSVSRSLSYCLSRGLSLTVCLGLSLTVCLGLSITVCLGLSLTVRLGLSLCKYLGLSLYVSLCTISSLSEAGRMLEITNFASGGSCLHVVH